jgi:superfamily II DNA or RNA helicase
MTDTAAQLDVFQRDGASATGDGEAPATEHRPDVPAVADRPAAPAAMDAPTRDQLVAHKAKFRDWVYLFRVGGGVVEFYHDDAWEAYRATGIPMVPRLIQGGDIVPTLSIPEARQEEVIAALVRVGRKVAVAEPVGDGHGPVEVINGNESSNGDGSVSTDQAARGSTRPATGTRRSAKRAAQPRAELPQPVPDAGAGGGEAGAVRADGRVEEVPALRAGAGTGDAGGIPAAATGGADRPVEVTPTVRVTLSTHSIEDYRRFLRIKSLPRYRFTGHTAELPAEYAEAVGIHTGTAADVAYEPWPGLFDYQRDISAICIRKEKFAVFADCGLGKTRILTEFARHATGNLPANRCILIVSPLMVIGQTLDETSTVYGDSLPIDRIPAAGLQAWLNNGAGRIGITNYEALTDELEPGRLGGLILDESSLLKSHYGKWGATCIRLGKGLRWKLAATGTPAPNDRIEYANHAVFLDQEPNVNAFLARYFVNRGQTDNRWELKPHALGPFYRSLSHWSIFLTNPGTYGWRDNAAGVPPILTHIHNVPLTDEQNNEIGVQTGQIFVTHAGGITQRTKLARIAKGSNGIPTNKPNYIRRLVDSWPDESTIIWCLYNDEQASMERVFPEAASITGDTPYDERERLIAEFKSGARRILISKGKILGFGLNLQKCTRMVFSGLQDSYETFYQCVKRANRYGSTRPLNVHIPITSVERPMIETVLSKAKRVQADAEEQERLFKGSMIGTVHKEGNRHVA